MLCEGCDKNLIDQFQGMDLQVLCIDCAAALQLFRVTQANRMGIPTSAVQQGDKLRFEK